ncbi:SDR family NAD(P)-dependent oxidoreductase [Bythopirellula goksoeyrii]|uniref:2-(S)-hydroxypropyl-CoM dehydrogenase n=1 Tax=Bythopirellula goksoeyrii TaxID=1400387 RepID=A0A5B9QHM9_9BACT|nr:SDR family oxidoreductase [Bythopirellula goksoeyrii]QEG37449.1 2-(S)-hydroxypropyl-CoM dehydrogenase [Bythopirellula goksoeyrii]
MSTIAILGATGSIGSALARHLVAEAKQVLLLGRDHDRLAALAAELDQPFTEVNFSASQSLEDALLKNSEQCGGYQGIVNCIGSMLLKPAHSTSDEEFRETIHANLFTTFSTIRAGGKVLRRSGGSIVLFASAAAEIGIPNHEAIAAAKGGVISMARSAAATYAAQEIRVNVISPGLVRTSLTKQIWSNPAAAAASTEMHALGRLGESRDLVAVAVWLLDPSNSWITGQVIGVDGGLSSLLPRRRQPT